MRGLVDEQQPRPRRRLRGKQPPRESGADGRAESEDAQTSCRERRWTASRTPSALRALAGAKRGADSSPAGKRGLKVATVNGTAWPSIRAFAESSAATVICGQETRLLGHKLRRAKVTVQKMGWKAVWAEAAQTEKGGISAGAVVLAKPGVELARLPDGIDLSIGSRAVSCLVAGSKSGWIHMAAAYFKDGEGLGVTNRALMKQLFMRKQVVPAPMIIGMDANMSPQVIAESGWPARMHMVVVHGGLDSPTFTRGPQNSVIDFYLVDERLVLSTIRCTRRVGSDQAAQAGPVRHRVWGQKFSQNSLDQK